MTRIPIRLRDESLTALQILARQEYRDLRQQAAWIIEHELERRGLLVIETQTIFAQPMPAQEIKQGGINVKG